MRLEFELTNFLSFGFEFLNWCNVCHEVEIISIRLPFCGFRFGWGYYDSEKDGKRYRNLRFNCWAGIETRDMKLEKRYMKEFGKKIDWDDI